MHSMDEAAAIRDDPAAAELFDRIAELRTLSRGSDKQKLTRASDCVNLALAHGMFRLGNPGRPATNDQRQAILDGCAKALLSAFCS